MPDGYVTIARFSSTMEAELSRLQLEAADIPACVFDSHMNTVQPLYGIAVGVRVQVPASMAEEALDVLKNAPEPEIVDEEFLHEIDTNEDGYADDFDRYQDTCPRCGSVDVRSSGLGLMRLMARAMGVYGAADKPRWTCRQCSALWHAPSRKK